MVKLATADPVVERLATMADTPTAIAHPVNAMATAVVLAVDAPAVNVKAGCAKTEATVEEYLAEEMEQAAVTVDEVCTVDKVCTVDVEQTGLAQLVSVRMVGAMEAASATCLTTWLRLIETSTHTKCLKA